MSFLVPDCDTSPLSDILEGSSLGNVHSALPGLYRRLPIETVLSQADLGLCVSQHAADRNLYPLGCGCFATGKRGSWWHSARCSLAGQESSGAFSDNFKRTSGRYRCGNGVSFQWANEHQLGRVPIRYLKSCKLPAILRVRHKACI